MGKVYRRLYAQVYDFDLGAGWPIPGIERAGRRDAGSCPVGKETARRLARHLQKELAVGDDGLFVERPIA